MSYCLHVQIIQHQLNDAFLKQSVLVFAHHFILYNLSSVLCPFLQYAPETCSLLREKGSYCFSRFILGGLSVGYGPVVRLKSCPLESYTASFQFQSQFETCVHFGEES